MQHVGDNGPPAELGLVLVHGGVVLVLVDGVFAAPTLSFAISRFFSMGRPQPWKLTAE